MHPLSALGLPVAAALPTLLRHGRPLTLRVGWPERPARLIATSPQVLASPHRQPFGLLVTGGAALAAPALSGRLLCLLPLHTLPTGAARATAGLLGHAAALPAPSSPARPEPAAFSPRKPEVMALLLTNLCQEGATWQSGVRVRTAESHCRALLQKAAVRTLAGLAVQVPPGSRVRLPDLHPTE